MSPTKRPELHVFVDAPDLGDPRRGVQVCARCQRIGKAGDANHTMPDPAPDARGRAAGETRRGDA
ncbi:hypothetical protein [Actinoplanes teichomyceticus]|uniref:Uncharacterized protein n=1 Tax=Actinoplanes teichomyceticus TaxID=1867 RepID=A0A561WAV1_ACTTI|nr:hypothetical protein [Actinoplanes teichomyceticus]TWG20992.1 hypothetical protein FHX34_103521 [Actinoplanes teichomyceticus]GIF14811.1 hypothetical protein Ate01nite_48430 [Actinoplanes teichomyceticus]